jgi:hypothetical protein
MIMPPWVRIAVPIGILVIAFFAGFRVASWRDSGKIEKAIAERDAAVLAASEAMALEKQWREDVRKTTKRLTDMKAERDKALADYFEESNKPPEVVIEYRDRVRTVREVIQAEECVDGVGELFTYLHSLPRRPQ